MTRRPGRLVPACLLLATAAAVAAPRDVEPKRFARVARILLLPDEAALLRELRDDRDRALFQQIFWARRDPTPGTPANEFQDNVIAAWARADELFSYPGRKGSETGCGQVLALLGRPEEVVGKGDAIRRPSVNVTGRDATQAGPSQTQAPPGGPGRTFDNMAYLREGATRDPETWVYRDRPGVPFRFTGAELRIDFDAECQFAEAAGILGEDLRKAAAVFVTRPEIGYASGSDGRLLPLAATAASTGASAGARALLSAPRSDFELSAEPKLLTRAPKGETYVAGLVSARPAAPAGSLSLAVQAKDADGRVVASAAREATAAPQPDGSVLASWGLALKPGRYALTVAAALPDTKGSVASLEVEVPDLGGSALAASPLVLYPDEPPAAARPDARDAFAAFPMGGQLLRPRYRNVFTSKDALMVVAAVCGARPDPTSGQAALKVRYSILKDGRPVARGPEDAFTAADAVASVGPIPLAGYAPGAYVVRLDVTDAVAKQTLRQESPLEIRP